MCNFKKGTATEDCSLPLERPLLELCNELSPDSVECSVLPLGGAKHNKLLFFKINFIKLPVMLQSGTWVVFAHLHTSLDNKLSASF